jgi:hypothetical protein
MSPSGVLHVVTVGRSILDRLDSNLPRLRSVLDPALLTPRSVGDTLCELTRAGEIDPTALLPDDAAADIRDASWRLTAEWTSLKAYRAAPAAIPDAAVIYVASDTEDGLRAATLVALHDTRAGNGYNSVLRYQQVPDPEPLIVDHTGRVVVVRVPGLDFSSSRKEGDRTWRALGDLGRTVARTAQANGWSVVLHLSGGFKAAIPYLLVMAEGIRTRLRMSDSAQTPRGLTVSAVCVHESSIGSDQPYLVALPVRYLSEPVHKMLTAPDALGTADLRGQFTLDATPTEPARFSWAGTILTRVLRGWP